MQYWSMSARCGETVAAPGAGAAADLGAAGVVGSVDGACPLPAIARHSTRAAVAIAVLIRLPAKSSEALAEAQEQCMTLSLLHLERPATAPTPLAHRSPRPWRSS